MKATILFFLFFLLGLVSTSQADPTVDEAGRFMANFPGPVKQKQVTKDTQSAAGNITAHGTSCFSDNATFVVNYFDYPWGNRTIAEQYQSEIETFLINTKMKLRGESSCKLGDIEGRDCVFDSPDLKMAAHTRLFIAGNRAYQVGYCGLSGTENSKPAVDFLDSFRLATDDAEAAAYRIKATADDVESARKLGLLYYGGQGVPKDYAEALKWLQMAADHGDAQAQNFLGFMYEQGLGVAKDYGQAFSWHQKSADQGNASAQYNIGEMYYNGQGVPQDYGQALIWYQKAAGQGYAAAQSNIGWMYQHGQGVAQDYTQAFSWYQKAADQGNADAQDNIGLMYFNGQGVAQDYRQALSWFQKAADQGNASAQYNIGGMYYNGQGVPQDYGQALIWYQKAAGQGLSVAQNNLGSMYQDSQGVPQDYGQALIWYQKAADQGLDGAQDNIGFMYFNGQGVAQDYRQALSWFQKAADQGYAVAQYNIGWMYENGRGVTKDIPTAVEWYQKAAAQGQSDAQAALKRLTSSQPSSTSPVPASPMGAAASPAILPPTGTTQATPNESATQSVAPNQPAPAQSQPRIPLWSELPPWRQNDLLNKYPGIDVASSYNQAVMAKDPTRVPATHDAIMEASMYGVQPENGVIDLNKVAQGRAQMMQKAAPSRPPPQFWSDLPDWRRDQLLNQYPDQPVSQLYDQAVSSRNPGWIPATADNLMKLASQGVQPRVVGGAIDMYDAAAQLARRSQTAASQGSSSSDSAGQPAQQTPSP